MAEERWREWRGERGGVTKPTGYVEIKLANGATRKGHASFLNWNCIGHNTDIRYWRPASNPHYGETGY